MSEKEASKSKYLLTFLGVIGAFLTFVLVVFVAYLPNRPAPVDHEVIRERQERADASRAAGRGKLQGYEVLDAQAGTVRIPIERAMNLTVSAYRAGANQE